MEERAPEQRGFIKLGPFRTKIDDVWISGKFADMPIELEDRTLLDLGIHKAEEYDVDTGSTMPQVHYITWTVELYMMYGERTKESQVGIFAKDPEILSIESSVEFEYYEPHSDDPKTYQWEATLNLSEWNVDASDFTWATDGSLAINHMEMDFSEKKIYIQS